MTIKHWTDDKIDYTFWFGKDQIDVRLEEEDRVDQWGTVVKSYHVYARHAGAKDWLLVSTITEPKPLKESVRRDTLRSLVRMFENDLPKV